MANLIHSFLENKIEANLQNIIGQVRNMTHTNIVNNCTRYVELEWKTDAKLTLLTNMKNWQIRNMFD